MVIPIYKITLGMGVCLSLSKVLKMATDWTCPRLTFSLFRWQVAFISKVEEDVIPWASHMELGMLELFSSL